MHTIDLDNYNPERESSWNDFVQEVKAGITSLSGVSLIRNFGVGESNELLVRIANSLGRAHMNTSLVEHPLENGMVFRVEPRGNGIQDARKQIVYSTTGLRFPCHTDGSGKPVPYHMVLLYCVRQDKFGGDSILITLWEVVSRLKRESLITLREESFPFPFGRAPIISGDGAEMWIRYNTDELDYYAGQRRVVFSKRQIFALADLNNIITLLESQGPKFRLSPGECLAFDNRRVLHGRSALMPASTRLLKRVRLYWR